MVRGGKFSRTFLLVLFGINLELSSCMCFCDVSLISFRSHQSLYMCVCVSVCGRGQLTVLNIARCVCNSKDKPTP